MSPRPRACGRQGAGPGGGGSIPHERNHGAGDHPIPFRTRQLSPASPKVLRRQVAGGQGVPLMGDGFGPAAGPGKAPDPTGIRGLPAYRSVLRRRRSARSRAPARAFSSRLAGICSRTRRTSSACRRTATARPPCRGHIPARRLRRGGRHRFAMQSRSRSLGREAFCAGSIQIRSCSLVPARIRERFRPNVIRPWHVSLPGAESSRLVSRCFARLCELT